MLDIYSQEEFEIKPLTDAYGMEVFERALKNAAWTRTTQE